MILDEYVEIKISNQGQHYKDLGYENVKQGVKLKVKVEHLQKKSCAKVNCKCDECGSLFERPYQQVCDIDFHRCYCCARKYVGEIMDVKNIVKSNKRRIKENHPRFNPNKPELQEYSYKVRLLTEQTYKQNIDIINPFNYPRTLCGVEGGYQLDHIISIKYGFENNITPEELSDISNLQMLPWEDNRNKWHK